MRTLAVLAAALALVSCTTKPPTCSANQALTGDGANVTCVDLPMIEQIPDCAAGEVLSKHSGTATCEKPLATGVPPTCATGKVLTFGTGGFSCVDPGTDNTAIAGALADLATLKADVAALKADVATLKTDVATLKTDSTAAKADVATLKTDVTTIKGDVTQLKTDVAPLKAIPTCAAGRVLTFRAGAFSCVDPTTDSAGLAATAADVVVLKADVAALKAAPAPGPVAYVGRTTTTTNGNIQFNSLRGIKAANAMCDAQVVAGSRMCTTAEVLAHTAAGKFADVDIAKAWVLDADAVELAGVPTRDPGSALANSCADYTYGTADTHQTGTAFQFALDQGGAGRAAKFFRGTSAFCNQTNGVACCK
ncbi:MAG: hypothetical protein K1X89_28400 [Myxococcaceae bacterium]|nr:hypothetical protein [Myxococcaceae bacterium]